MTSSKFLPSQKKSKIQADTLSYLIEKLIEEKLHEIHPKITCNIISRTKELIRLLQTKCSVYQRLCKYDSYESRLVVTLAYVLRHGDGNNIPNMKQSLYTLGKIVGLKRDAVDTLKNSMEPLLNDLNDNRINFSANSKEKNPKSSKTNTIKEIHTRNNPSLSTGKRRKLSYTSTSSGDEIYNPLIPHVHSKYLHSLSLKLQLQIQDPYYVYTQSEFFFQCLVNYMCQSNRSQRAMYSDLERNRRSYEGACIFLIIKEHEEGMNLREIHHYIREYEKLSTMSLRNHVKSEENNNLVEEVEQPSLDLGEVIDSLHLDSTTFISILNTVLRVYTQIRNKEDSPIFGTIDNTFGPEIKPTNLLFTSQPKDYIPTLKFMTWKENILRKVTMGTRIILCQEKGMDLHRIKGWEAMERAATNVLKCYDI